MNYDVDSKINKIKKNLFINVSFIKIYIFRFKKKNTPPPPTPPNGDSIDY